MKHDIIEIRSDQCHFPVTESSPHTFCCDPIQPGSSYCPAHHARCHSGFGRPWKSVEYMMLFEEKGITYTSRGRASWHYREAVRDSDLAESPVTVPVDVHIRGDR